MMRRPQLFRSNSSRTKISLIWTILYVLSFSECRALAFSHGTRFTTATTTTTTTTTTSPCRRCFDKHQTSIALANGFSRCALFSSGSGNGSREELPRRGAVTSTTTNCEAAETGDSRTVARMEKFARLPVWPVWQGVLLFLASRLFGEETAAAWEDAIGGRVCPNFFSSSSAASSSAAATSPFVLLVHHRHAFMNWDPVRYIQRTFFPEGFPSHPHRGFITVTYCLKGGMIHRDSLGVKQFYGAEPRHGGKHVQWLTAGAGIQHEEMWDLSEPDQNDQGNFLWSSSQELYQIWLNLPAAHKMSPPAAQLLQSVHVHNDNSLPPPLSTPVLTSPDGSTITTIISGHHQGITAPIQCPTNASIIRIQLTKKHSTWTHTLPSTHETAILYVRSGSIHVDQQRIPSHYTAYLTPHGTQLTIHASEGPADVLLLSGEPLREPIASRGSMVMNTDQEIQQAYFDFQRGFMGIPWEYNLSDQEWRDHVNQNPSKY